MLGGENHQHSTWYKQLRCRPKPLWHSLVLMIVPLSPSVMSHSRAKWDEYMRGSHCGVVAVVHKFKDGTRNSRKSLRPTEGGLNC